MKTLKQITIVAAALGMAATFAMPVSAAPDKDDCKARFGQISPTGDILLSSKTGKKYSQVATMVDVNNDGKISADEYTVACTKDLFKGIDETG